ncbi:PD-(D/E)XK nuclease family protein [Methanocalculus sp.]|uniref:PD-(D/E)XK nuclease family protein n=1 Tax=Methanocalculus sp. TaxID=2004547 RepID=UPI002728A7B3|nr:PD-(D/E)XK nuclease family protein [Methanocalculus sp.]MDO8841473.1 PD-(D/E)XK nuclease family protein [Methanocalculus sp.]
MEAILAVAEMRLANALQRLMNLERCRLLGAGEDPASFDRDAFLSVAAPPFEMKVRAGVRPEPDLIDDIHLAASALSTYEDCPLRFKFGTLLRVPTKPKTFFSLGTVVHTVCEAMARRKMEGETVRPRCRPFSLGLVRVVCRLSVEEEGG